MSRRASFPKKQVPMKALPIEESENMTSSMQPKGILPAGQHSRCPSSTTRAIIYLAFNFFSTVAVTFVNKTCFSRVDFGYPAMLCNIHFLVTWIGVESLRRCKVFQVMNHPPSLKDYDFFVMALVLGLVTPLNNASLKLNGIGFYQIFKLLLTPGVVLLEYLLDGKILSRSRSSSLMLVCFFVLISSRADMEFSVTGAALATLWIPFASMYKVQWGRLLKKYQCSTLSLMYVILPYAMVVQCAISPLVDPPGILQYKWTREAVFWIGLSGLSAFLVNYSGFLVIGNLGALTHVLLGQCKTAVIMVGAYILFQSHYSALQLRGALGAVLAIVMYTHVTVREMHLKEKKPLADEQSLPLVSSNEVHH